MPGSPIAELGDRVRVLRAEVYARVLNLTPEEAEKFWPIFNEYAENKESLQKQLRSEGDLDGMSDQEVEDYVKKYFEVRQKEFDLEKDLVQKLRKVLPVRKMKPSCPRPNANSANHCSNVCRNFGRNGRNAERAGRIEFVKVIRVVEVIQRPFLRVVRALWRSVAGPETINPRLGSIPRRGFIV